MEQICRVAHVLLFIYLLLALPYVLLFSAQREYTRARALFKDVSHKAIDWPEAIWQLWVDFEHLHGSVEDLEHCLEKVKLLSLKLEKKRAQVLVLITIS